MKCDILKDFPCAADASGTKAIELKAGTTAEVPDDLVAGLEAEGYVKRASDQRALPLDAPADAPATARDPLDHDGDGRKGGTKHRRHK